MDSQGNGDEDDVPLVEIIEELDEKGNIICESRKPVPSNEN